MQDFFRSIFDFPYFKFLLAEITIFLFVYLITTRIAKREINGSMILLSIGLICLGFVTGSIMGNSRNPISDTIITSVFALAGSVITFIFVKKEDASADDKSADLVKGKATFPRISISDENRNMVSLFLILFPISLLYGAHNGGKFRLENESFKTEIDFYVKAKTDSIELSRKQTEYDFDIYKKFHETAIQHGVKMKRKTGKSAWQD